MRPGSCHCRRIINPPYDERVAIGAFGLWCRARRLVRELVALMVLRERLLAATLLVGVLAAGVRAADDEDNPYKEEPDKTTECYGWAADGQCASNPSFMLSSCK